MNKPWLKQYPKGVPAEIGPIEYTSIANFFESVADKYAGNAAFFNMGTTLTYGQIERFSANLANFLRYELDLKKNDRVAIMMPNLLQHAVAILGILRAELVVVNVNPLFTPRELEHQLNDSGAKAIIVLDNFCHTLAKVIDKTQLQFVITTRLGDMLNAPKSMVVNFVARYVKNLVPKYKIADTIKFNDALHKGSHHQFVSATSTLDDIAFLQYTGGTTGICKSAVLTHGNLLTNMEQATQWISYSTDQRKKIEFGREVVVAALPLYHIFSLTASFLTFMNIGSLIHLITNPRDLPGLVKDLKHNRFTCIPGVNTLFNHLSNTPGFSELDFSELKITIGGGMAVQANVAERWKAQTGCTITEAYGLTETSPAVCINPLDDKEHSGSIGLPISSTDCCVIDERGQQLPFGQTGELCVRGPQVMQGYWNRPKETKNVFTSDGWLKTGDIAKIMDDGYIYLVDRKKDVILVSGFNVFPNDIEAVISNHPDVLECGVIGVPDEDTGEAVKAFVVKKNDALNQNTIQEHCRNKLTRYKMPKHISFIDELPKSNIGKILRRELRDPTEPT